MRHVKTIVTVWCTELNSNADIVNTDMKSLVQR